MVFTKYCHLANCRGFAPVFVAILATCVPAAAQLQTLSRGNTDRQWRDAQLEIFDRQLADPKLPEELKLELAAQRQWLAAWDPTAAASTGELADQAVVQSRADSAPSAERLSEPNLDPSGLAAPLRERLFGTERPTTKDTLALQKALTDDPTDLGLRQLQMHWIDQERYRDDYWKEIVDASGRVTALIGELPPSEESKQAAAFAYYRKARALSHCLRGLPLEKSKIAGADALSGAERQTMQNTIGECSRRIETLVGAGRAEFFQLEVYVLRRDGWQGRALELLDRNANAVDEASYLKARHSLLESLAWTKPAAQVAARLAALDAAESHQSASPAKQAKRQPGYEIEYIAEPSQ